MGPPARQVRRAPRAGEPDAATARPPDDAGAVAQGQALALVTGVRLRRLQALFARHWSLFFRGAGIELSSVQGGLLLLIGDNPGLPQAQFARLLDVEPPSLAQTLAPLVRASLVERRRDASDGRAMALRLTKRGETAARRIADGQPRHEARLLAGLTNEERRTLLALLDKAVASAERALAAQDDRRNKKGLANDNA